MKKHRSQYQSGALVSYCSTILNVIIGIFFTPFLVRKLGQTDYGLYQMIGSLVGYLAIFEFGLGTTVTRYVAKYRAEQDIRTMQNFLALCLKIYMVIGGFILAVCAVLYFNIGQIFGKSLGPDQLVTAKEMFLLLALNISASLIFQSFSAIMTAYEKFVVDKLLAVVRIVLRCLIITVLLLLGYHAVSIVVVDTALNVAFSLVRFLYCRRALNVRFRFHFFDRRLVKEVFVYSGAIFAIYIIGMLNNSTDKVIVGITSGTAQVSICAVGMTLFTLFEQFGQSIIGMVLPKATEIHVASTAPAESYMRIFVKSGRAQLLVLTAIVIGFTVFGRQFVVLWVGADYQMSYWVALLIMWAYFIPFTGGAFGQVLEAQNKLKGLTSIYAVSAVLNVVISIPLAVRFGAVGSALGTAVTAVLGNNIAAYIYYSKVIKVNMKVYFKSVFSGYWITVPLMFCFGFLIDLIGGSGWVNLIGKVVLFLIVYAANTWFISLNSKERQDISGYFRLIHVRKRSEVKVEEQNT